MPNYSTAQVAERLGIHKATLIRWLLDGKVREPRRVNQVGQEIRIWTDRDVQRVQRYKQENYRKGRGRKPKLKL
jgi:excisionase family DNA binding protein